MEQTDNSISLLENVHIVGIGASAGGLEAITEFFDNVRSDIGCAFVIVQHLSPDYKSLMPELLTKHTKLPITVAEDNMFVKPGNIYLIPHKKNMTISFGKLKLKDKEIHQSPNMTIDIFFKSLSEYKKEKAIGIVLSGTGSDGSKGLGFIKEAGGFTMVQDPVSAKFDGMPNSAIATGFVDFVLTPEMMFEEIVSYIRQTPSERTAIEELIDDDEDSLKQILDIIKNRTEFDFTLYKRPTIIRRIVRRIGFKNFKNLQEYKEFLLENEEEIYALCKEFLIGVTRFFRDYPAFDILAKNVIPEIIRSKNGKEPIKVWVAGCSTGEEAYTLAMLFQEGLEIFQKEIEVKIFATDLDRDAVDRAGKGIFSDKVVKEISPERVKKYFERIGEDYKINPAIRKMVIFAAHDLNKDAPFSKMDLVTCRNLLIYLGPELQRRILSKFHFSLNVNGYLFLGPSENLGDVAGFFTELSKKWKIYQNVQEAKNFKFDAFHASGINIRSTVDKPAPARNLTPQHFAEMVTEGLMNLSGYSVIFVNEELDVVHAIGDFRNFIQLPERTLDFSILKMVPEDLSILLGASLRKAFKNNEWVNLNGNRIDEKKRRRIIDISVQPSYDKKKGKMAAIYLKERSSEKNEKNTKPVITDSKNEELIVLKHELAETKENLQSLIEELETTNEEMQSSNEELTSANEELQSTNEELQSLNEELHTVNAEHQQKIRELLELNDDLNNYFSSTDIGQVFVDSNLFIRKFTPAVKDQINLIEKDIGRPISHISHNIKYNALIDDLRIVSTKGGRLEREIQMINGDWYLMKLLPYISHDKSINGVVLAFVNIDKLKMLNDHLSGILSGSLSGIMTFNAVRNDNGAIVDLEWTLINPKAEEILGKEAGHLLGKKLLDVMPFNKTNGLFEKYVQVSETGVPLHMEYHYEDDQIRRWLEIAAVKLEDGLAVTFADITDKKESQEKIRIAFNDLKRTQENLKRLNNELENRVTERTKELSISEERFRILSLATNDAIWDWDLVKNTVWLNEGFNTIFGFLNDTNNLGIEYLFNKIHPEDKQKVTNGIQEIINTGKSVWSGEYRLLKSDGTYAFVLDRAYVLRYEEDNMPYRMIGSMVDLTSVKKAHSQLELTNENLKRINNDLDSFIYTASHDLRAPISNIEGLISTLMEILEENKLHENEELIHVLELINKSISKFKETIKDLTEIAKVQKENIEDLESITLLDIIEDVKFSIKDMFISTNAVINYHLQEPSVVFSKKNLKSIFYNLISNAIKYKAQDRDPVINVYSEHIGEHIVVSIRDNGLGIAKEKQNKAFEMFKRMHDHVEGTGIGLYIVKRAMENSGGKVEMISELGNGSEFKLYFKNPILSKEKAEAKKININSNGNE